MDCSSLTGALSVLARPEAEGESQLDQVGYMMGVGVGGGGRRSHDELYHSKGVFLLSLDWRFLDVVSFNLAGGPAV